MRRFLTVCLCFLLLAGLLAGPALAQGDLDQEEWDDRAVADAIKRAVEYLWSRWANGNWEGGGAPRRDAHGKYGGRTALCTYALLAAGVSPQDPRMKQTLEWLSKVKMTGTYAVALRCNVWAMLGPAHKYRKQFAKDVKYLVDGVDGRGAYNYIPAGHGRVSSEGRAGRHLGRYDNSNSQLGVLGVWAGAENRIEVPIWYWEMVDRHWRHDQQDDGGWCYQHKGTSYGSMSVAGLATMFICFDALYYKKFVKCRGNTDYLPIVRGLRWLDKNFSVNTNPGRGGRWYYYYLYGVERVGLASGYKYFGKKDWYKMGVRALLQRQGAGGGWHNIIDTSFALLFLARGRHPVLFNKLKYPGTWNSRPRDLANLTRWVSRKFERTVNWQIVNLSAPVRELHDAPILYISGASAPHFTDEDIAKLREFVLQGGVIFSEAACNRASFTLAMKRIYARMFPEYELRRLPPDHPIYRLHFTIGRRGQMLWGISNGIRLLVIHAPSQVSLAWQLRRYVGSADIFRLGANIYFYVTDKGILPPRGMCHWPKAKPFRPLETIKVVPVKYNGNWNPEPYAWKRFAILMGNRHAVKVELAPPAEITKLDAASGPVAVMTGTTAFALSEAQKQALEKYLEQGGTLVVDAAGGSTAFADAAERLFKELLKDAKYGTVPADHALFKKVGPVIKRVRYRKALRRVVFDPKKPRLRGFLRKGRLVVIFSPDDLTAGLVGYPQWGLKGYEPESAFEVMRNILLYASGKTLTSAAAEGGQEEGGKWKW